MFERKVSEVFAEYVKRLHASNAMDFDDLILHPIRLFDEHPEVLAKYQQQFRYILIDEYRDTNCAQQFIVRRLAEAQRNICVVGDDAQKSLRIPRRGHPQHPRLREAFRRCAGLPSRAELPFDQEHSPGRIR